MTVKALHTKSKIFFSNPYVVRVEYDYISIPETEIEASYRKLIRNTYRLIKGTWGHSLLLLETVQKTGVSPLPAPLPGQAQIWALIFNSDCYHMRRGYFCFKDELDALQFRLSTDVTAVQVVMWPKEISFTIHEATETDEQ